MPGAYKNPLMIWRNPGIAMRLFTTLPRVGYVTFDHKGCIQEINLTGASLIGLERSQLIGMPMFTIVAKSDLKLSLGSFASLQESGC